MGSVLKEEVKSGRLFAFGNRRRTRLKILYWDGRHLASLSKAVKGLSKKQLLKENQELREEVQKAPEHWRLIGAEVSEQLDYEPGRFLRRRLVRRKYVRRGDPETAPVIAAVPPSLQERCIVAPGLLAQIIVSKFCDHPSALWAGSHFRNRHGVHLPRQSMARWMGMGQKPLGACHAAPLTLAESVI